ncbi:MAG: CHAT domain-containing protein [Raineya sp.]|jgi:CHAT domain-containing protein|nr:CHAT domain-containing protein [Raineya sp.]
MKDFFYGSVHKKRGGSSLLDEYEDELALKKAKEFSKGMTMDKIKARLAEMDELETLLQDDIITYVVQPKDNPTSIVRKFFPYMILDSPEFVAKRNEIIADNGIKDVSKILIGREIKIKITAKEKNKTIRFNEIRKNKSSLKENPFKGSAILAGVIRERKAIEEWALKNGIKIEALNLQNLSEEDIDRHLFALQESDEAPEILYFGTHGVYAGREDSNSGNNEAMLETGDLKNENLKEDDGVFTASELRNFKLNGVVLTYFGACHTQAKDIENALYFQDLYESKKVHTPEEDKEYARIQKILTPMGRVAIEQGSRESVGGLWCLMDEFTADFTDLFSQNYIKYGKDTNRAVRETQLYYLKKYKARYWGPFMHLSRDFSKKDYTEDSYDKIIKMILEGDIDLSDSEMGNMITKEKSAHINALWEAYQEASKYANLYTSFDNINSNQEERFKYNTFMQNKAFYRTNLLLALSTPPTMTQNTTKIQEKLKENEAVVDIKRRKLNYGETYLALITTKNNPTPLVVEIEKGDEVKNYIDHYHMYSNSIKLEKIDYVSYNALWSKIMFELEKKNVNKIYFGTDGIFNQININTLYDTDKKQYLIEKIEVQYLF